MASTRPRNRNRRLSATAPATPSTVDSTTPVAA